MKTTKTNQTVYEILAAYLESEKIRIKPSTYAVYERYLANHITPNLGKIKTSRLSKEHIQNFVVKLNNGLSAGTIKSVISFLKCGLTDVVPAGVFKVKLPKAEPKLTKVFSVNQQKQLEEAAKKEGQAIYLAIVLCLYLGLRVGEVAGLKWSDIDFEGKCVHIQRTVQRIKNSDKDSKNPDNKGKKTKIVFQTPKSKASFRTIPLPPFLVSLLKGISKKDEFVISEKGKFIEPRTIQNRFKKVLKSAGLEDTNFHSLRHTFATRALESGFDSKTLSEVLGHSNPIITMKRYAHCLNEHKRKAMNLLSTVWNGKKSAEPCRLTA